MYTRFIVVARPRSRTSWLSTFMNANGVVCQHDIIDLCPGPEAYREALDVAEVSGAVDTGAVLFLPTILNSIPDCRVAVIHRPKEECEAELEDLGISFDLDPYDEPMFQASLLPGAMTLHVDDLENEVAIRKLWHHLVEKPFPLLWYDHCKWLDIQPSKNFFDTEFKRRAQNSAILTGWR